MKRFFVSTAIVALAFAALPARAQDAQPMTKPMDQKEAAKVAAVKESKDVMKSAGSVRADIVRSIDDAQKKLLALAEAIPADKYAWRPAPGVRSTGEVFAHVSGANYFLPTLWGGKIPAGVDPRGFEKEGGDKAKTVATLKASFDSVRQVIDSLPAGDLDKAAKIFDHEGTVRELLLIVATHAHEHLGQAIAYARMNGVTPPWSAQPGQ
jgi:uncharacterized damage-inducible protein DinB